jgi:alpha-glucosidase
LLNQAISVRKYAKTYAKTDIYEYWAEGVQNWLNVNAEVPFPDGKHHWLNTRKEFKSTI